MSDPNPGCKHHYRYVGIGYKQSGTRYKHRPYSVFKCQLCSTKVQVVREALRALVRGDAKRMRRNRLRYPTTR